MSLIKRLQEPSSMAGIGLIGTGLAHLFAGDVLMGIGQICAGVGAVLIPEGVVSRETR